MTYRTVIASCSFSFSGLLTPVYRLRTNAQSFHGNSAIECYGAKLLLYIENWIELSWIEFVKRHHSKQQCTSCHFGFSILMFQSELFEWAMFYAMLLFILIGIEIVNSSAINIARILENNGICMRNAAINSKMLFFGLDTVATIESQVATEPIYCFYFSVQTNIVRKSTVLILFC